MKDSFSKTIKSGSAFAYTHIFTDNYIMNLSDYAIELCVLIRGMFSYKT